MTRHLLAGSLFSLRPVEPSGWRRKITPTVGNTARIPGPYRGTRTQSHPGDPFTSAGVILRLY